MTEPQPATRRAIRAAAPAAAGPSSRAGRNLPVAIASGVVLGAGAAGALVAHPVAFVVVICVAMVIAVWEMRQALSEGGLFAPFAPVAIGAVSMIVAAYVRGAEALVFAAALTLVATLVWRVADGLSGAVRDVGAGALILLYPCLLAGFAAMMLAEPQGQWRIFVFIIITIASDIGGYAFGVLLGKHPMAPKLSPKKSWEGFAGSVISCALVGAIAIPLTLDGPWWQGAVLGALVAPVATIGDLIESSLKRNLGIKDMSNIIPGHGGLMDRLDSLVLVVPLVWVALRVIAPH
ncbi:MULTISPECIES: phosphatidate cytidylyltransferase [Janibacter]|uniref:phosphatidate cytidylyltransferase n=1 Tax=Janibacter TaxID=53457 RepID=UPI0021A34768|nr:phosphatidate cytidylyltransferase [Janibacter hoylei]MCT1620389.1 phosphatidate cytidylyltransferase [Janibacter hoylei]MCT2292006.1 phosphatidate cytidylyltransferase [Janibacter hoylei]MCW4602721.1 phosphatidate cytidylyltransferase [Janibacter hoylei]